MPPASAIAAGEGNGEMRGEKGPFQLAGITRSAYADSLGGTRLHAFFHPRREAMMPTPPEETDFNTAIMAKFAKSRLTRCESPSVRSAITLHSPEMKRRLARDFNSMQGNLEILFTMALLQFPGEVIERLESSLDRIIKERTDRVERQAIDISSRLRQLWAHSLTPYPDGPLTFTVRMYTSYGRRYLELIGKTDRLLQSLETLAAAHGMQIGEVSQRKAHLNRAVKEIAIIVRTWKQTREQVRTAQDFEAWPNSLEKLAGNTRLAAPLDRQADNSLPEL